MRTLALVATACLARLLARPWYEHVASRDNPADVLSRDDLEVPVVKVRIRTGEWRLPEPVEPNWRRGLDFQYWWWGAEEA